MNIQKKIKTYSQLWDEGIKSGIIAEIGDKNFLFLATLAAYIDKNGWCNPTLKTIAKKLGKSEETVKKWLAKTKKTTYQGEPILIVKQAKRIEKGKVLWGSNGYTFSKPIFNNLLGRGITVGKELPTEEIKQNHIKSGLPKVGLSPTEKPPTNDNHELNKRLLNDKRESLKNKFSFNRNRPFNEDEEF